MKHAAAVLTGSCACLFSAAVMAATPEGGNRASMLSIIVVAVVMIVLVKLVIALARRKLEREIQEARGKPDSEARADDSHVNG